MPGCRACTWTRRPRGGDLLLRLLEIGFLPGERVHVVARAFPAGEPMAVRVGHHLCAAQARGGAGAHQHHATGAGRCGMSAHRAVPRGAPSGQARRPAVSAAAMRLALLGHPNCGKTALFNLLTGSRQKVANYAGVTVERKEGVLTTPGGQDRARAGPAGCLQPERPECRRGRDARRGAGQRAGEAAPDLLVRGRCHQAATGPAPVLEARHGPAHGGGDEHERCRAPARASPSTARCWA